MFVPQIQNHELIDKIKQHDNIQIYNILNMVTHQNINFYVIPSPNPNNKKWIVFSHGNVADIYKYYLYARHLASETGANCLFYDYPGYGMSDGTPTSTSCVNTLSDVINGMTTSMKISRDDIYLMGQSIGTGVVVKFAYDNNWKNPIILISPYESVLRIFPGFIPYITDIFDKYPSIEYVEKLDCPIKIFHGTSDSVIKISHSFALEKKMKNKTFSLTQLQNIGHNDILENINSIDIVNVLNFKHN